MWSELVGHWVLVHHLSVGGDDVAEAVLKTEVDGWEGDAWVVPGRGRWLNVVGGEERGRVRWRVEGTSWGGEGGRERDWAFWLRVEDGWEEEVVRREEDGGTLPLGGAVS